MKGLEDCDEINYLILKVLISSAADNKFCAIFLHFDFLRQQQNLKMMSAANVWLCCKMLLTFSWKIRHDIPCESSAGRWLS